MNNLPEEEHAIYSPSAIYRNMPCVGAIAFIKRHNLKGKVSKFAEEGTLYHKHKADAVRALFANDIYDYDQIVDEEMREHVKKGVDFIAEITRNFRKVCKGVEYHIEKRIKFDESFWGTGDFMLTGIRKDIGTHELVIVDDKYGKGVVVEAEENEQCIGYAVCAQEYFRRVFSKIHVFIYQPRTPGKEFTRWSIDQDILCQSGRGILANKRACMDLYYSLRDCTDQYLDQFTLELEEKLTAGEHCRFCPAAQHNKCPAYLKDINSTALKVLDTVPEVPELPKLTTEQKIEIFKRRKMINKFIDDVCADLLTTANKGVKLPGLKIVEGQRRRKWIDNDTFVSTALAKLGVEDPCVRKLKGITEIEKEIGKGKIGDLTELSKPTYQLVPESDKRTEVQAMGLEDIGEIEFTE